MLINYQINKENKTFFENSCSVEIQTKINPGISWIKISSPADHLWIKKYYTPFSTITLKNKL
jgi:hypothetical protein